MSLLAAHGLPLKFCSPLSSGLKVEGTQPSFQPRVMQEEEDRESGIGSTLDLSGSCKNDNRRTNHRSDTLPHWEAGGHPEGKGTGVATRVTHHHLPFKEKGQSTQDRTTRSLGSEDTREASHVVCSPKSRCHSAVFGCRRVKAAHWMAFLSAGDAA